VRSRAAGGQESSADRLSQEKTLSGLLNRCLADWIAQHDRREIEVRLAMDKGRIRGAVAVLRRDLVDRLDRGLVLHLNLEDARGAQRSRGGPRSQG
jgi:hypothetical protein